MQRRFFSGISLLLLSLSAAVLSACGGGGSDDSGGNATLRLVNVARDENSLDLFSSDTNKVGNPVLADAAGDYNTLASGTYTLNVKRTGSGAISNTSSRGLQKDTAYTLLAYRAQDSLRTAMLSDGESAPTAGTTKLRVINLAVEAGTLDVFVTPKDPDVPLSNDLPINFGGRTPESVSNYSEFAKGTYRVRVTGTAGRDDLRLDLPSVDLVDGQILSLVLTSTSGGVLVNGHTLLQKGTVSAFKNPSARVRLVAGLPNNGGVAATVNGTTVSTGLASPSVGLYKLVPASAVAPTISVNGVGVVTDIATLPAGSDWTLTVVGDAAAPKVALLADNYSVPTSNARANIRVFNGVSGLEPSKAAFNVNSLTLIEEVGFGQMSRLSSVDPSTTALLELTSPAAPNGLVYTNAEVNKPLATLAAGKIYTLFVFGNNTAPATGRFVQER